MIMMGKSTGQKWVNLQALHLLPRSLFDKETQTAYKLVHSIRNWNSNVAELDKMINYCFSLQIPVAT